MSHRTSIACVLCAAAAAVSVANAEFVDGNLVYIQGVAGPIPGTGNAYTYWGSNVNGQYHALGSTAQHFEDAYVTANYVSVTSWVNSPTSITFSFDFSNYNPSIYPVHALEILGLKNDGSLSGVTASQGTAAIQNNGFTVRWDGLGVDLGNDPKLILTIEQVPAPGALALISMVGIAASRRRRS